MLDQLEFKLPRQIGLLLLPGYDIAGLADILDTFHLANTLSGTTLYAPTVFTPDGLPALAAQSVHIHADETVSNHTRLHALFVLDGGHSKPGVNTLSWVHAQTQRCTLVVCVGGDADTRQACGDDSAPATDTPQSALIVEQITDLIAREHGAPLASNVKQTRRTVGHWPSDEALDQALLARIAHQAPQLATAVRLMKANVEVPLRLPELTRRVGLSMRQLERLSAAHLQRSPQAHYLCIRLDHAAFLIRDSQLGLAEIAQASGFGSLSYFRRRFREQFGFTPRAALELHRADQT